MVEGILKSSGMAAIPLPTRQPPFSRDASGSWGCGAWHGNGWFQIQWDRRADKLSIAAKELFPNVLTCAIWGHAWHTYQVRCLQVVVAALQSRLSRDPGVMHLLRCLVHCHQPPVVWVHRDISIGALHIHLAPLPLARIPLTLICKACARKRGRSNPGTTGSIQPLSVVKWLTKKDNIHDLHMIYIPVLLMSTKSN